MGLIRSIQRMVLRNMANADAYQISSGQPVYSTFTVAKAVKDGYKINPTVYRAVQLKTKAAASVSWMVYNEDREPLPEHHLSKMFKFPNPFISRQDVFELIFSWLELAGNAYLKKVQGGGQTAELWPISPDRLYPLPSKSLDEWLLGYVTGPNKKKVEYEPHEIIHLKYFNPANPLLGIGPLQAVAKTVDVDIDQQDWNKSAMKNRGVLDGIVSFDRTFRDQDEADVITERLNETGAGPKNARRLRAVGSNAKYVRTALTPVEMDFTNSRKENRNEIFITLGVPPQYAGAQESSTYNNYLVSQLVFWGGAVIPNLDDVKDTFNFSFREELKENESINYDTTHIQAMLRAMDDRTKIAKRMFNMGVPYSQINKIFELGVEAFDGWEKSYVSTAGEGATPTDAEEVPDASERSSETVKKKVFTLRSER